MDGRFFCNSFFWFFVGEPGPEDKPDGPRRSVVLLTLLLSTPLRVLAWNNMRLLGWDKMGLLGWDHTKPLGQDEMAQGEMEQWKKT